MNRTKRLFAAGAVLAFLGAASLAQQQPDLQKIAAGVKQNQEALRQYAWQSRVTVEVDGEQNKVELYQMRYDMDGQLQKTPMGGESDQKKVRGPIRKRIAAKKKGQATDFVAEVKEQLQAYMSPSSMEKALSQAFSREDQGALRLQSRNVVEPGDSVEIELVQATHQPMSLQVKTTADGTPVELSVTFQKLDSGPSYPARSTIITQLDGKALTIVTENFSYLKQDG